MFFWCLGCGFISAFMFHCWLVVTLNVLSAFLPRISTSLRSSTELLIQFRMLLYTVIPYSFQWYQELAWWNPC